MTEAKAKEILSILKDKTQGKQIFISTIYNDLIEGEKKVFKLQNGFLNMAKVQR
jgi:hypothetical protein